jgi:hypothetical protein
MNKMATDEGGRVRGGWSERDNCERVIGPWFKSPPGTFFLANLANFHVATILAISTYITPNI